MVDSERTCSQCGEVQPDNSYLCARCGNSMETEAQHRHRLMDVELSRREVEHRSVAIQRLPGFGTNGTSGANFGTRQYFSEMSNQRRRQLLTVIAVFVVVGAFFWSR